MAQLILGALVGDLEVPLPAGSSWTMGVELADQATTWASLGGAPVLALGRPSGVGALTAPILWTATISVPQPWSATWTKTVAEVAAAVAQARSGTDRAAVVVGDRVLAVGRVAVIGDWA